ncbi:hypothetical protein CEE37_14410 [candidate division LCP-89 bacterium B3_LCP]|uniref:Uncharacterized protein n=1 Tax=candidate division LCP-89 bacterium B3_LCP TaxID=2012998 RepID=A0A532UPP4_UNCL8|nr:MAG: hypothetical protein CEE37_14410 [candidate division LCP-89 bacterium B3_LCP]
MKSHTYTDLIKRTRLSYAMVTIFLILTTTVCAGKQVTFYVTDFGIGDWNANLNTGSDFSNKPGVYPNMPSEGQILVVMPPDEEFNMSDEELIQNIYETITEGVTEGQATGVEGFEVQLVQNINLAGYGNKKRQAMVARFGRCAYAAIGRVIKSLAGEGVDTALYAILGSNGTVVFSKCSDVWKFYKEHIVGVFMYDGRALKKDAIKAVQEVGADKVTIFNTAGDAPAGWFIKESIGNLEVVKKLKELFPNLTCIWLDPLERLDYFKSGHIAGMKGYYERFLAKEWTGSRFMTPREVRGCNLLPVFMKVNGITIWLGPGDLKESRAFGEYIILELKDTWYGVHKIGKQETILVFDGTQKPAEKVVTEVVRKAREINLVEGSVIVIGGDSNDPEVQEVKRELEEAGYIIEVVECGGLSKEEALTKVAERAYQVGAHLAALVGKGIETEKKKSGIVEDRGKVGDTLYKAVIPSPPPPQPIPTALDPDRIGNYILKEKWKKVAKTYDDIDPNSPYPVLRMIKGHACLALNRNNESLALFLSVYLERDLLEWEKWAEAYARKHPQEPITHYFKGDAKARLEKWDEAQEAFDQALALDDKHVLALNALGVVYAVQKELGLARYYLEKAIDVLPNFADPYSNLGFRFIQMKDGAEGALDAFNKALEYSGNFSLAVHGKGCIEILTDRAKAIEDLNLALEELPEASMLFGLNQLNIEAYMSGLELEEMAALLTADEDAGTYFGLDYTGATKAWDNYVLSPNQTNYNNFCNKSNTLSASDFNQLWDNNITPDLTKSSSLTGMTSNFNDVVNDWNRTGAGAWINGIGAGLAGLGAAATFGAGVASGGNPLAIGGTAAGTAAITGAVTNNMNSWKDYNLDFSNKIDQNLTSLPTYSPGGVAIDFSGSISDKGDWPFQPFYGLMYSSR